MNQQHKSGEKAISFKDLFKLEAMLEKDKENSINTESRTDTHLCSGGGGGGGGRPIPGCVVGCGVL